MLMCCCLTHVHDQPMENRTNSCKSDIVPDFYAHFSIKERFDCQINVPGNLYYFYICKEVFNPYIYFISNFKVLNGHMIFNISEVFFENENFNNNSEHAILPSCPNNFTVHPSHYLYVAKNISKPPFATIYHACSKPVPKLNVLVLLMLLMCGDTGVLTNPGPVNINTISQELPF